MKNIITAFTIIAVGIVMFGSLFILGLDKEAARVQYKNAVEAGDFERPIEGCIFKANCETYTEMLLMKGFEND